MLPNISQTEENYLKAIFNICEKADKPAGTNDISNAMQTSAASVTDMLKRLAEKKLINYEKYKGVTLTEGGNRVATQLIRKHRLWETFLVEKLQFSWDKVHDIAEQLEHIKASELVEKLDDFLGNPKFDPHGDPIPDADGKFTYRKQIQLSDAEVGEWGVVVGVQEDSEKFLQYLDKQGLVLGARVKIIEKFSYDESIQVILNDKKELVLSDKVSRNLFIQRKNN
jgi:DtxR family Mn-dependent transcriptional regulator